MAGQCTQINFILDQSPANLDKRSHFEATPLIVAIQHGKRSAVQLLIKKGSSLSARTSGSYTPLLTALHEGDREIIRDVLKHCSKEQAQMVTEANVTSLMLACELKDTSLVKKLIDQGVDVNAKNREGTKALDIAVKRKDASTISLLIQKTTPTAQMIKGIALHADQETAPILFEQAEIRCFKDPNCDYSLIECIQSGNVVAAKCCFYEIDDMDDYGDLQRALKLAMRNGFTSIVTQLKSVTLHPGQLRSLGYRAFPRDQELQREALKLFNEEERKVVFESMLQHKEKVLSSQFLEVSGLDPKEMVFSQGWTYAHYLAYMDDEPALTAALETSSDYMLSLIHI